MASVIDNGQTGFSTVGTWNSYTLNNANQYGGNYQYNNSNSAAQTATWDFTGLTAGDYQVSVCFAVHSSHSPNAPYDIYEGSTLLYSTTVNQTATPSDVLDGGSYFQHLGSPVTISGTTLKVVLNGNGSGNVIADAVRVEYRPPYVAGTQVYPFRQWVENDFADSVGSGGGGGGNVIVIED